MYIIKDYKDLDDLKYKLASDSYIIEKLVRFAQLLGYNVNMLDKAGNLNKGFKVLPLKLKSSPILGYLITFDQSLTISIAVDDSVFNFNLELDPDTLTYDKPTLKKLEDVTISTFTAINKSEKEDTISNSFTYQLSDTVSHNTSNSLRGGIKVGSKTSIGGKTSFKVPFIAEGEGDLHVETSVELSADYTRGWSDSTSTTNSSTHSKVYTCQIPARSKRQITLFATINESEVKYSGTVQVGFVFGFSGTFNKENANNKIDNEQKYLSLNWGDEKGEGDKSGFDQILEMYDHKHIPHYSEWDWEMMQKKNASWFDDIINFFREGIGGTIDGKFTRVKGVDVRIIAEPSEPLTKVELLKASDSTNLDLVPTIASLTPGVNITSIE